mmetsp:Transcript_81714/g.162614  ORF Transcript_81714/g.162614 Transcript_81714/m.162614 type:complete len:258 (-) Transcript_81714:299-1072(-)
MQNNHSGGQCAAATWMDLWCRVATKCTGGRGAPLTAEREWCECMRTSPPCSGTTGLHDAAEARPILSTQVLLAHAQLHQLSSHRRNPLELLSYLVIHPAERLLVPAAAAEQLLLERPDKAYHLLHRNHAVTVDVGSLVVLYIVGGFGGVDVAVAVRVGRQKLALEFRAGAMWHVATHDANGAHRQPLSDGGWDHLVGAIKGRERVLWREVGLGLGRRGRHVSSVCAAVANLQPPLLVEHPLGDALHTVERVKHAIEP